MKERGILFSGPMVRAILAGRKTQTRRAVKPTAKDCSVGVIEDMTEARTLRPWNVDGDGEMFGHIRCPYGAPGDRLWVRETHQVFDVGAVQYRADFAPEARAERKEYGIVWTPSLLMPRWASRITLSIESIRVERAQAISDADVDAEGVDAEAVGQLWTAAKPKRRAEVEHLTDEVAEMLSPHDRWEFCWTLINGRESWDANPWCWVIEFKRVDAGVAK